MMRYAELYGNIKKPRIKNLGDNKKSINAFENTDLTNAIDSISRFTEPASVIGEQVSSVISAIDSLSPLKEINFGVDTLVNNDIQSAMGKFSLIVLYHNK